MKEQPIRLERRNERADGFVEERGDAEKEERQDRGPESEAGDGPLDGKNKMKEQDRPGEAHQGFELVGQRSEPADVPPRCQKNGQEKIGRASCRERV